MLPEKAGTVYTRRICLSPRRFARDRPPQSRAQLPGDAENTLPPISPMFLKTTLNSTP